MYSSIPLCIYMDIETKLDIIQGMAEEIVTRDELKKVFEVNDRPVGYNGFELSGIAPIHFGLMITNYIKKMLKVGVKFNLYMADYFTFINDKMGGDIEKIRDVGKYFVEVWKAGGIDPQKVNIVWCKDLMQDFDYWETFLKVGKAVSLDRVKRAITIMGRKEGDALSSAQLFYPIMQVTDIFQMDIDICQLGMDQRKANILAREVAHKYNWKVPIAVHNPLLLGLKGMPKGAKETTGEEKIEFKMSKSDPKNAIFVHDSFDDIKKKVNSAYCPEKIIDGNPMFDFIKNIILETPADSVIIERSQKFGGDIVAENYTELAGLYQAGKIHPLDLKGYVAAELESRIKPIREYFEKNRDAKELYQRVRGYATTR
jgi:tyrosyl-tRNA synthetase